VIESGAKVVMGRGQLTLDRGTFALHFPTTILDNLGSRNIIESTRPIRRRKPQTTPIIDQYLAMKEDSDPWDWLYQNFKMPVK
jgi:hypothetical protein